MRNWKCQVRILTARTAARWVERSSLWCASRRLFFNFVAVWRSSGPRVPQRVRQRLVFEKEVCRPGRWSAASWRASKSAVVPTCYPPPCWIHSTSLRPCHDSWRGKRRSHYAHSADDNTISCYQISLIILVVRTRRVRLAAAPGRCASNPPIGMLRDPPPPRPRFRRHLLRFWPRSTGSRRYGLVRCQFSQWYFLSGR